METIGTTDPNTNWPPAESAETGGCGMDDPQVQEFRAKKCTGNSDLVLNPKPQILNRKPPTLNPKP